MTDYEPTHYIGVHIVPRPASLADNPDDEGHDAPGYVWVRNASNLASGLLPESELIPAAQVTVTDPDGTPTPPPTPAAQLRRIAGQLDAGNWTITIPVPAGSRTDDTGAAT